MLCCCVLLSGFWICCCVFGLLMFHTCVCISGQMLVGGIFHNLTPIYHKINLLDCGVFFLYQLNQTLKCHQQIPLLQKKKKKKNLLQIKMLFFWPPCAHNYVVQICNYLHPIWVWLENTLKCKIDPLSRPNLQKGVTWCMLLASLNLLFPPPPQSHQSQLIVF